MPNFTQIGQTVWISIRYEHIYIYIYFVLYILDRECHAAKGKQTCSCFEAQLKFLNFFI
jgi:hypothetical protein